MARIWVLLVVWCIMLSGCGGLGFEVAEGVNATVVAEPNYNEHVAPIMRAHCDVCHASVFPGSGDFLSTSYDDPEEGIEGVFSARLRIESRCLNFEPSPMPPSTLPQLPLTDRETLRRWILSGAPRE